MTLNLANSVWEFRAQRAPHEHSDLHLLGLAILSAGAAETEAGAHGLLWDALDAADPHAPVGVALGAAGLDRREIFQRFRAEQQRSHRERHELEIEAWRRALV